MSTTKSHAEISRAANDSLNKMIDSLYENDTRCTKVKRWFRFLRRQFIIRTRKYWDKTYEGYLFNKIMYIDFDCFKHNVLFKDIMDRALELPDTKLFIDEKYTADHPGYQRCKSKLSYEEAWSLIKDDVHLHKTMLYRDVVNVYWDLGCCNISSMEYGDVFIFIELTPSSAEQLIQEFKLKVKSK